MKKINLLFDATVLLCGLNSPSSRTGIYFFSLNILKVMKKKNNFNISLFINTNICSYDKTILSIFRKNRLISHFRCYYFDQTNNFFNSINHNIKVHHEKMLIIEKIHLKFIYLLKIIKNYLLLIIFYKKNNDQFNEKFWQSFDVFLSPVFPIPAIAMENKELKCFTFLHDAIAIKFPEYFDVIADWYTELLHSFNKSNYYFCVSQNTRKDFLDYYGNILDNNKLFVIPVSTAQHFVPKYNKYELLRVLKKYGLNMKLNDEYILSFCTLEPRKNIIFTLTCFYNFIIKNKIENLYFILGGTYWDNYIKPLEDRINSFGNYKNRIIRLGYVKDKDVNILYSNSLFFTYISLYEGFGTPPLEAMQAGTPVITSNNSSIPEVVGESAIKVTCNNENECIKAFEDLYFNIDLRKQYIISGLQRSKYFSWEKTVDLMTEKIFEIVEK